MLDVPAGGGALLLRVARTALETELFGARSAEKDHPQAWLQAPAATFVSLHRGTELQGCIGSIDAKRPLIEDVRRNAVAAAIEDPRFPPLEARELDEIDIEISLLSRREPLTGSSEEEILRQLIPARDGILLAYRDHRATFLPQVWEALPDPVQFLSELKEKAGLATDFWHREMAVERYTVLTWEEERGTEPSPR